MAYSPHSKIKTGVWATEAVFEEHNRSNYSAMVSEQVTCFAVVKSTNCFGNSNPLFFLARMHILEIHQTYVESADIWKTLSVFDQNLEHVQAVIIFELTRCII